MLLRVFLVILSVTFRGLSLPIAAEPKAAGDTKNMLDAMVQLLTGSREGFDSQFFAELQGCMLTYDIDLVNIQDAAWGGMIEYSQNNGKPGDEWGECLGEGHCVQYQEYNATAQEFHNITIYEPCNYASNVAFYHVVTQICAHAQLWNLPHDHVKALLQGFASLAMGSSFWHGSHTFLGNVADNRFIDVLSFTIHQASLQNLPEYSPVIHDLSMEPRSQSAVETTTQLLGMFQNKSVNDWTEHILAMDTPDYFITFSGIVCTYLTLLMEDDLTDQLIPKLMDLFKLPEEQREFILNFYLPEIRNATSHVKLTLDERKELEGNIASTMIKLIYAFLWQEHVLSESPIFFDPLANVIGTSLIKYVNMYANSLNSFPIYDQNMQDGRNIYPGNDRCNYDQPHSKWHLQSANGLLDMVFLADFIFKITEI